MAEGLTGLYYLRARYYNASLGRFTQEDVIYNDGLNLYEYCSSNPVMYADPSGDAGESVKQKTCGSKDCGNTTNKYQKASLWERLTNRKAKANDLHANPLDDISNPKVGPSESAVAKYMKEINTTGKLSESIEVQKLSTGGYEIVNGHHKWLAAKKVGLKKVPIKIKNYKN